MKKGVKYTVTLVNLDSAELEELMLVLGSQVGGQTVEDMEIEVSSWGA